VGSRAWPIQTMSAVVQVFGRRHDERHLALGRPTSKNRQGTKSREVGRRLSAPEPHGSVTGFNHKPTLCLPQYHVSHVIGVQGRCTGSGKRRGGPRNPQEAIKGETGNSRSIWGAALPR
jgi:hypothetical protein